MSTEEMSLEDLFCAVDDFCRLFLPDWHRQQLQCGERKRRRGSRMVLSEIMTILIHFHQSITATSKPSTCSMSVGTWPAPSRSGSVINRFVALIPTALVPLCVYLQTRKGQETGISFIDATSLVVCHNRRIHSHKVFKKIARRGKTSVGWFYGFKLHLVVNDCGELLAFQVTPGNTDDRNRYPVWSKASPVSSSVTGAISPKNSSRRC